MTLTQFTDLCWQQWANARGNVTGLSLTDEGYGELELDGAAPVAMLVNPVTRTVVTVTAGAPSGAAHVRRHYGLRHVPLPQARTQAA